MLDYLIYIGRFQPFHNGHEAVIRDALTKAKNVIVLIGSANLPRSPKNPFTYEERKYFIENNFRSENLKIHISPILDYPYDEEKWLNQIWEKASNIILKNENPNKHTTLHGINDFKIGIIGHEKDTSSYYLKALVEKHPKLQYIPTSEYKNIHATSIRTWLFGHVPLHDLYRTFVPLNVYRMLQAFVESETYERLKHDYHHVNEYNSMWNNVPFPVQFHATDAIVRRIENNPDKANQISGKYEILLIQRGKEYGHKRYALPGGYLEKNLSIKENILKELKEEVNIDSFNLLNIKPPLIYDYPSRSHKGRIVTYVFNFGIRPAAIELIKAGDDADSCVWVNQEQYESMNLHDMFEDHHMMIEESLGWKLKQIAQYERE